MADRQQHDATILDLSIARRGRKLMRDAKGVAICNEANALQIIGRDQYFETLHFDDFSQSVRIERDGRTCDWNDDDDTAALEHIQRNYLPKLRMDVCARAVRKVARERRRDALRDFIESLPQHDGVPRIDTWAIDALGCADSAYTRTVSSNFIKACVARARQPGADVNECLVLEGPQGIGKTRAVRALGGTFYFEITAPIGSPDFMRELRGTWLADLAELSQIKRGSVEVVKQVLSRHEDRFVEKYEREARCYPRRCVFVGTTNERTYLADSTGNRRFVPLRCGTIRVDLIEKNRAQYFAEALARVRSGETWWEVPVAAQGEAQEEREARRMCDPWEAIVAEYVMDKDSTTAGAVLLDALSMPKHEQKLLDQQRAGRVLSTMGWIRGKRARINGAPAYPWTRPESYGTTEQQQNI